MKFRSCALATVFGIVLLAPAHAQDLNFVDRFIVARGNCQTGATNLITQPFGKPIDEWVAVDLLKMRAALARCHAEASWERWTPLVDQSVTQAYAEHQVLKARRQAKLDYEREQAVQAEQRRKSALAAEKVEAERQEQARAAAERDQARQQEADLAARQQKEIAKDHERRAAMQEQARRDRVAAEQAKRLAEQEAPLIAAAEREASEARKARLAAEQALNDVRQRVATVQEQRAIEDAAIATTKAKREQFEKTDAQRKSEKREDEALAKTCSVSVEQFEHITIGMSLREVRRAFACTGSLTSSTEVEGLGAVSVYQWDGARSGAAAQGTFSQGRLVAITQSSLD